MNFREAVGVSDLSLVGEARATDHERVVVCSFHTLDRYYAAHAERLRFQVDRLGFPAKIEGIHALSGEEWPDICRKKIGFLARVSEEFRHAKIIWVDVDSELLSLPRYITTFSADIIGFQRGFKSPLQIGYRETSRFWCPGFFGINSTEGGRRFISRAHELERTSQVRATDDYFLEEAWRELCKDLSYQFIPSSAVVECGGASENGFIRLGDSGNVATFVSQVEQHGQPGRPNVGRQPGRPNVGRKAGKKKLPVLLSKLAKCMPERARPTLKTYWRASGLRDVLLGVGSQPGMTFTDSVVSLSAKGEEERVGELLRGAGGIAALSKKQSKLFARAQSILEYTRKSSKGRPLRVAWWVEPTPGNFGDWTSPFLMREISGDSLEYVDPKESCSLPHIFSVGSIGRFIQPNSFVIGTGVSRLETNLCPHAVYWSVRGPETARLVKECGGKAPERFGDPALALSRICPQDRKVTGRIGLIRHYVHKELPIIVPEGVKELEVLVSSRKGIESFLRELNSFDFVLSSAMHGLIACHSYGIPCGLITFDDPSHKVSGDGTKYRDYFLGAGLKSYSPIVVGYDLRRRDLSNLVQAEQLDSGVVSSVFEHLVEGIDYFKSNYGAA